MQCDTCKQESSVVMRVVIAKDYNRILAKPLYNCPACFEQKEQIKAAASTQHAGPVPKPVTFTPQKGIPG